MPGDHIVLFSGVAGGEIKLGAGRVNVVIFGGFQSVQRTPTEGREGVEGFAVGGGGALAL